jgi:hypothetical protein
MPSLMIKCSDCKKVKEVCARSLCRPCYAKRWRKGTLEERSVKEEGCRKNTPEQNRLAKERKNARFRERYKTNDKWCRDKHIQRARDIKKNETESQRKKRLARDEEYRNRPGNSEKQKEYGKAWYQKNKERLSIEHKAKYEANPEPAKARARKWAKDNPEALYLSKQVHKERRRANLNNVENDDHTIAQLHKYWRSKGIDPKYCTYCDEYWPKWKTSMGDHVLAVTRGGSNTMDNIVPACIDCNRSKFNKILYEEWIPPKERLVA